jgi:hypothetical protein
MNSVPGGVYFREINKSKCKREEDVIKHDIGLSAVRSDQLMHLSLESKPMEFGEIFFQYRNVTSRFVNYYGVMGTARAVLSGGSIERMERVQVL